MSQACEKVHLVSLGCPKNRVDSEVLLGETLSQGRALTTDPRDADIIIVNTCAFLQSAVEESIETILDLARYKKIGVLKKLIVAGCLPERYSGKLAQEFPEVDEFIGAREIQTRLATRLVTTPSWTTYIKISEGCNHNCSFCIIPQLRGRQVSRSIESLFTEIRQMAENGTKEFNLIAQDSTDYGVDLKDGTTLEKLFATLNKIPGELWFRLMYAYPLRFSDELIDLIAESPNMCKYVDLPLQHINDSILKSMLRGSNNRYIYRLIDKLKKREIALRTTFIVGFPGETEEAFYELEQFVKETEFDRLGVFTYSPEEGSPAATLPNPVPEEVKKERQDRLMALQRNLSLKKHRTLIGKTIKVLVEGETGRSETFAPEIDGGIRLTGSLPPPGSFAPVTITKAQAYELTGEVQC